MSDLSLKIFNDMLSRLSKIPPAPVGIVYSARAYDAARRAGHSMKYNYDFMDTHQDEDCCVFYDLVLLRAYLNRREHPQAYLDAISRFERKEPLHSRLHKWVEMTESA